LPSGLSLTQGVHVPDQQGSLKGIGMVEVDAGSLLEGEVGVVGIVGVVVHHGHGVRSKALA